jgi:hypothetical protein
MNARIVPTNSKSYNTKDIQKYLDSLSDLEFLSFYRKYELKKLDLKNLICTVININNRCNTVDRSRDILQCRHGKRRSFSDLYRLTRHYYNHKLTVEGFKDTLSSLVRDNHIASYNCNVIKKRVFHFPSDRLLKMTKCVITGDGDHSDEFGWYWPAEKNNVLLHSGGHIEDIIVLYEGEETPRNKEEQW